MSREHGSRAVSAGRGDATGDRALHPPITLRPATAGDADLLLAWANDPETRAASFRPEPIPRDDHVRWLAARLASPRSRVLIGEVDGPVGQVRFELAADGAAEIGVVVAPERRGEGLASELLHAAVDAARTDSAFPVTRFIARIRVENTASIRAFGRAGFRLESEGTCDGSPCVVLELAA